MSPRFQPWRDYSGRVSPLKLVVFTSLFLPAIWIAVGYATHSGDFAARPLMEAIHQCGLWAIRFLMLSLLVTPARQMLQWPRLILVRRMIGVAAFAYIATHFLLYVADQAFDLAKVASEIVLRIYLTIGFAALFGLAVLTATSTDGMMRRLGRNWSRLHRIIYAIGVLAVIHYCMQSKLDEWEPALLGGLFAWLMLYRLASVPYSKQRPLPLWVVTAVTLSAALGTAVGEATYFWLGVGVDPMRVLAANLTLQTGVRPACIVLAAGLIMTGAALGRSLWKRWGGRGFGIGGLRPARGR
jgi:sulfoxide reductase heme-binding subunit YedZ